ncbi:MAG: hypothetical protein U1F23_05715 [Lysobacterales bacterium]
MSREVRGAPGVPSGRVILLRIDFESRQLGHAARSNDGWKGLVGRSGTQIRQQFLHILRFPDGPVQVTEQRDHVGAYGRFHVRGELRFTFSQQLFRGDRRALVLVGIGLSKNANQELANGFRPAGLGTCDDGLAGAYNRSRNADHDDRDRRAECIAVAPGKLAEPVPGTVAPNADRATVEVIADVRSQSRGRWVAA